MRPDHHGGTVQMTTDSTPRCWDCGASFRDGEGYGDVFCSEACADAYRRELGA